MKFMKLVKLITLYEEIYFIKLTIFMYINLIKPIYQPLLIWANFFAIKL
jgi:hypothetical protein